MGSTIFSANGKLLLFGEYAVLDGAAALAVPTVFGQKLKTYSDHVQVKGLYWKSFDNKDQVWFEAWFDEELQLLHALDAEMGKSLAQILQQARILNPKFLKDNLYHEAITKLNYPRKWGLGSSSTLIHLVAAWAKVNPMTLFFSSLSGSGYDIACAAAKGPILYRLIGQNPNWTELRLNNTLLDELHFVYLNKKQSSQEGIRHYRAQPGFNKALFVQELDAITRAAVQNQSSSSWLQLMQESEILISNTLALETVQKRLFPDFPGVIKSLGAWGGDFLMVLSPSLDSEQIKKWFSDKGFNICFRGNQLLYNLE